MSYRKRAQSRDQLRRTRALALARELLPWGHGSSREHERFLSDLDSDLGVEVTWIRKLARLMVVRDRSRRLSAEEALAAEVL